MSVPGDQNNNCEIKFGHNMTWKVNLIVLGLVMDLMMIYTYFIIKL